MNKITETMQVFNNFPGPKAGSHTLEFDHALTGTRYDRDGESPVSHRETVKLQFKVDAPRLALPSPTDVRSVYPAASTLTDHTETLPHLILQQRALPWSRSVMPKQALEHLPWMAILVLHPADMAEAVFREMTGAELQDTKDGVWSPWSGENVSEDFRLSDAERARNVRVLELSEARLRQICPRKSDLAVLAHIRRVSLLAKTDGETQSSGDFATLLANRQPADGVNVAVLVSLEGWLDRLAQTDGSEGKGRLIVLHRWDFRSVKGPGSFSQRLVHLSHGPLAPVQTHTNAGVAAQLAAGRVPIAWQLDSGERTVAWMRGPLSPRRVTRFREDSKVFYNAEKALVLDQTTGMMDVSYAAAWQLGQLLALSSSAYTAVVRQWTWSRQQDRLRNIPTSPSIVHEISSWLDSHVSMASRAAGVSEGIGAVCAWLTDLLLLRPIPLEYLIPSGKLIPPESLRFFHVDDRWLSALIEGALSLDFEKDKKLKREGLRVVLGRLLARHKDARQARGKPPLSPEKDKATVDPAALDTSDQGGFLMRSQLLVAYPGLEIELYGPNNDRMEVLRMDLLAEGLLFVLAEHVPTRIICREPKEGLRFHLANPPLRPPAAQGVIDIAKFAGDNATSGAFAMRSLFAQEQVEISLGPNHQ